MGKPKGQSDNKLLQKKVNVTNPDGSTTRVSVYGHDIIELADKVKQLAEAAERRACPDFCDVVDEWDKWHSPAIKYYTKDCYIAPIKDVKEYFAECKITDIHPLDIQRYMLALERKKYAKQTIKLRLTVLRQVYDYAILQQYVSINPCAVIQAPKNAPKAKRELPCDSQIEAVKRAQSADFGLFALLLLYTGLRRGEALALCYEDINRVKGTISINKAIVFEDGLPTVQTSLKSSSGVRELPLLDPLKSVLPKQANGLIFKNIDGKALTLSQFNISWRNYRRENGITITPHQLRHAYATICFDAGLDPKDAMRLLGHSKEEVTRDIYTHITESRAQIATDKLNAFIALS